MIWGGWFSSAAHLIGCKRAALSIFSRRMYVIVQLRTIERDMLWPPHIKVLEPAADANPHSEGFFVLCSQVEKQACIDCPVVSRIEGQSG